MQKLTKKTVKNLTKLINQIMVADNMFQSAQKNNDLDSMKLWMNDKDEAVIKLFTDYNIELPCFKNIFSPVK